MMLLRADKRIYSKFALGISLILGLAFRINDCSALESWEFVPLRPGAQKAAGVPGGEGMQYVHALLYAPSDPSICYLSTDTSMVWKSEDGGHSWSPRYNGFIANGARSLAVDPINPEIVFAAAFLGYPPEEGSKYPRRAQGIYLSEDGAANWSLPYKTDFYKQDSKGPLFAFDSSSVRYGRTWTVFCGAYNEGLLRSTDGGRTWRYAAFNGQHIICLKEDPASPGRLLVATESGLYAYQNGSVVKIGNGLPTWPRSLDISPQNPQVIYAAVGASKVYKSVNGGHDFTPSGYGLPSCEFTDLAVSLLDSNVVYVRADKTAFGPFFSTNGARSWSPPVNADLGNLLPDKGYWFSSPFAAHPQEVKTALHVSNGRARVLKSQDGGKNWSYSGSGFTGGRMRDIAFWDNGKMIFGLTDHGLYLTENDADTFQKLRAIPTFGSQESSSSVAARGNIIVASLGSWTDKILEVSYDSGNSWKSFNNLVDYFRTISFHPDYPNIVYAGPYKSVDGARTWQKLQYQVWLTHPEDGNTLYSVAAGPNAKGQIVLSTNGGLSWSKPYPTLPVHWQSVTGIAVDPKSPNRTYAATDRGVFVYDGTAWLLRNDKDGLTRDAHGLCYISCIAVDPVDPKIIYAGRMAPGYGRSNGIFRSRDKGMTWEDFNRNLSPGLTIWSLRVNPFDRAVYLGTSSGTLRMRPAS
jgi:photosystem II stability/assembly factor-like uncharacterized protein